MKSFSIVSIILCVFGIFAAASPIAAPGELAIRSTESGILDVLLKLDVEVEKCNKKWEDHCSSKCTQTDISNWQSELAVIMDVHASLLVVPSGWTHPNPTEIINICVQILFKMNACLYFLLGKCGLLGGLISLLIVLVVSLVGALKVALLNLFAVLGACIPDILTTVLLLVGELVVGIPCLCCLIL